MLSSWLKKISLTVCSLIFVFILLESVLWAISFFYLNNHSVKYSNHEDSYFPIVCVGDSYTMGVGAAAGDDYPSQLEKILNAKDNIARFRVINAGLGGCTTSMALNSLNSLIMNYKPKMLIVIVGTNDNWNYTDLNLSCVPINSVPPIIRLESIISRSRTYKLIKIGFMNLRRRFKGRVCKLGKGLTKDSNEVRKSEIEIEYEELATKYYRQHDLSMSADYFNKVLLINPMNMNAYNKLANIFREQGNFKKAMIYSIKILNMSSTDEDEKRYAYVQLLCLYRNQKKYDEKVEKILKRNMSYADFDNIVMEIYKKEAGNRDLNIERKSAENIDNEKVQNKLSDIRKELIEKIMRYNLEEIARIARAHKIKLIFCSYPEYDFPAIIRMEEVARKFKLVFIDLRPTFENILSRESRDRYFVPDGHCNNNGYRVMAKVIADRILSEL